MKKFLSIILSLVLVISILPLGAFEIKASAAWKNGYSDDTSELNQIKNLMREQTTSDNIRRFELILEEYPLSGYFNSSKEEGCQNHYTCSCGASTRSTCVKLDGMTQCKAFTQYCMYKFFDKRITQGITVSSSNKSSGANFKNYLDGFDDLTGTQFHVVSHSFTYLARDNTYIYFIDANSGGSYCGVNHGTDSNPSYGVVTNCKINLRRFTYGDFVKKYSSITLYTTAKSSGLGSGSTSKLTIKYDANGGKISSDTYGINSDGLVKKLSDNSVNIQVNEYGEYQEWGLYDYDTFGLYKEGHKFVGWTLNSDSKVYDMSTPWYPEEIYPNLSKGSATITAHAVWEPYKLTIKYDAKGGTISSDTYGINSDGLVKKLSDNSVNIQVNGYGEYQKHGLYDYDTFGLSKKGYKFAGWTLNSDTKVYDMSTPWYPEEIYPNLSKGSATITAHAVWEPYQLSVTYNANGGYISDDKSDKHSIAQDGRVFEKSVNNLYILKRPYGKTVEWGFTDDSTLGLVKDGYKFVGWTLDGKKVYDVLSPWNPEDIYPNLVNGDATITVTAVWEHTSHSYGAWKTTTAATCTKKGKQTRTCSVCSKIEEKSIAAKGHNYKVATCTKPKTCSVCGATSGNKFSHDYDSGKVTKKATCSVAGVKTYTCETCGATKTSTIAKNTNHTYKSIITKASTTKDGKTQEVCSVCSKVKSTKTIYKASKVSLKTSSAKYNSKEQKPTVIVKDSNGNTISSGNYTVTYPAGMKKVGSYNIKVTFKGNYSGSKTLTYTIKPISVSECDIVLSGTKYTYNGKSKLPSVTVLSPKGTKLTDAHYTTTYSLGRRNVGEYKVTVKMKGNYAGIKTLYFRINPAKTTLKSVSGASKSLKVSINKKTTQVTGYEIQYSTSKKFTSAKTKTITSAKTTSTTIKSLKAKTTYYVRVRTYKTVNGKKFYSGWSAYKSAKIK